MHDHQLVALNALLEYLLIAHYEAGNDVFTKAADGDAEVAGDMLLSACTLHAAARRSMRERNMLEAA